MLLTAGCGSHNPRRTPREETFLYNTILPVLRDGAERHRRNTTQALLSRCARPSRYVVERVARDRRHQRRPPPLAHGARRARVAPLPAVAFRDAGAPFRAGFGPARAARALLARDRTRRLRPPRRAVRVLLDVERLPRLPLALPTRSSKRIGGCSVSSWRGGRTRSCPADILLVVRVVDPVLEAPRSWASAPRRAYRSRDCARVYLSSSDRRPSSSTARRRPRAISTRHATARHRRDARKRTPAHRRCP